MSEPGPDDDLEALYARQRAADHRSASGFDAMRRRALETGGTDSLTRLSLAWHWALPSGAAVALGIALLLALRHPATPPARQHNTLAQQLDEIDAELQKSLAAQHELTAWQSPTDFLLHLNHIENRP